jgi:Rps23 Pro-64 3,4-dihydroxylase Tpa1-like proline 4-hydroxylase
MLIGHGTFVSACPNRLVVLNARTEHCVTPVARAAGDNARATVAGFFYHEALVSA